MGYIALIIVLTCVWTKGVLSQSISEGNTTVTHNTSKGSEEEKKCRIFPVNNAIHIWVKDTMASGSSKLLKYRFVMDNYTNENDPLRSDNTWSYKPYKWHRVVSSQGQTILKLNFNYDELSLMTLTFGVFKRHIKLRDEPYGCMKHASEDTKVDLLMDLTLRDLNPNGNYTVFEGRSNVCHMVIRNTSGQANFTERCCYKSHFKNTSDCYEHIPNKWLDLLEVLLGLLVIAVFVCGPIMLPDWIYSATNVNIEYVVKLKEPLYKTMVVCSDKDQPSGFKAKHTLDFSQSKDFEASKHIIDELPLNAIIPIKLSRFDIMVNYRKLLQEHQVPVGMIQSISRSLFLCKIREMESFHECCRANILGCLQPKVGIWQDKTWISACSLVGRIAMALCVPFPFYARIIAYYIFEEHEMGDRLKAANIMGLDPQPLNFRVLQNLSPTNPLFIFAYINCILAGVIIAYSVDTNTKTKFQQVIMESFSELKDMSMLDALSMATKNLLIPFSKYGIFGCFLCIVIWPFVLPIAVAVGLVYSAPIVFVTCRILFHTFRTNDGKWRSNKFNNDIRNFQADLAVRQIVRKASFLKNNHTNIYCGINCKRLVINIMSVLFALTTLYSTMFLVAEVVGFISEIIVFTLMGLIVNASKVLRYGSLIFLIIIYSYDTYNNVNKRYLKLNKALFDDIRQRIKGLSDFTSLPSYMQENTGFKACEASEQGDYELTDDLSEKLRLAWNVNDLILFVDNEDTPQIPRKLFDEVCAIQVSGSPGPVYLSLIKATVRFCIILLFIVFVFLVVMSFGDAYKISSTNTTIATLAGGFMPLIFTSVLAPGTPQIETGLLSFRSKLEEIIQNFHQDWPMYDFVFDFALKPDSDEEDENDSGDEGKSKKDSVDKEKGGKTKRDKKAKQKDNNENTGSSEDVTDGPKFTNITEFLQGKYGKGSVDDLQDSDGLRQTIHRSRKESFKTLVRTKIEELDLKPAENDEVDIIVIVNRSEHDLVTLL